LKESLRALTKWKEASPSDFTIIFKVIITTFLFWKSGGIRFSYLRKFEGALLLRLKWRGISI